MKTSLEHLLRLIFEQATEFAIILLDPDGQIRSWNPGAERIFGMPAGRMVGRSGAALFLPEDVERGIPDLEMRIARTDGMAEDDRWMARPDGSRFWATGAMVALRDPSGALVGFGKILRNRTDLKELIESYRLQAEASDAISRRKDVFLSTLSHELRNPLAPLSHAAQILRLSAPQSPDLEPTVRIIERQVDNLRRLVDDLLDITRISVGKVELRKRRVSIQEVIGRALESARPAVRERRHDVSVLLPPVPVDIEGDPDRLEQVFLNLVQNAAKYTP
jgi:PAS domain S-box-containing protein